MTRAFGINDSGQIVGIYTAGGTSHGYLRISDRSSYDTIDFPDPESTFTNMSKTPLWNEGCVEVSRRRRIPHVASGSVPG